MKNTVRYLLFIVALVVAVVVFQMAMPHRFDWTPSFGHDDKNPFGGYVFDSLMAQTLLEALPKIFREKEGMEA